jgi:hypothetical protein
VKATGMGNKMGNSHLCAPRHQSNIWARQQLPKVFFKERLAEVGQQFNALIVIINTPVTIKRSNPPCANCVTYNRAYYLCWVEKLTKG